MKNQLVKNLEIQSRRRSFKKVILNDLIITVLTLIIFYLSLLITSMPLGAEKYETVNSAIEVLEQKGFDREVFLLRRTATFRSGDNWLNTLTDKEKAYAATNFPLGMMTLYPDFFSKTHDDTERAMILLHEAQHLKGGNELEAYAFVWQNRHRLGWTQLSHGTTPTFITVEELTREQLPQIFTCPEKLWDDCTEILYNQPQAKR